MGFEPIFPTDRITYRDGQRLWASDLRDTERRDESMRWLHVRYLHRTWGVALGYEIQLTNSRTAIVLGPGYAIDQSGRDLLLAKGLLIPTPQTAGAALYVLTIRYGGHSGGAQRCGCGTGCGCAGHPGSTEVRPQISWNLPADLQLGDDVPLVSANMVSGIVQGDLDFRVRRNARRLVRPHIGWNSTDPGQTGWERPNSQSGPSFVQAVVDTSEAGFTRTPFYFAALKGDFSGMTDPNSGAEPWPTPLRPEFFLCSCGFIARATPTSFTYEVLLGRGFPVGEPFAPEQLESRQWTIDWIGLEPVTGCAPRLDLTSVFDFAGVLTTVAGR